MASHKTTGKEGEWRGGRRSTPPLSSLEKETVSRFKSASPPPPLPVFPLYPSHPHPFPCSFYSFFPHPLLSFSALGCLFLPPQPRGEIEDTLLPPSLGIPAASWGLPLPPAVPAAPPPLLRHHCRRISLMDIDPSEKAFTAPSLFPPSLSPSFPTSPSLSRSPSFPPSPGVTHSNNTSPKCVYKQGWTKWNG